MKILLVCAGGMSTGLLMNKMKKYWSQIGEDLEIRAAGLADYNDYAKDYEMILVGPQVSYRLKTIAEDTGKPCSAINSTDYALGNCEHIYEQAKALAEGEAEQQ